MGDSLKFKDDDMGAVAGGAHRTGVSFMLKNAIVYHLDRGEGFSVCAPSKDFLHALLSILPADRAKDLFLFDPKDRRED